MKVWLVESGAHEDRELLGVFSSEEKAHAFASLHGEIYPGAALYTTHREVDAECGKIVRLAYIAAIGLETGTVGRIRGGPFKVLEPPDAPAFCDLKPWHGDRNSAWATSYESFEHAEQVARDHRQAWLDYRAKGAERGA